MQYYFRINATQKEMKSLCYALMLSFGIALAQSPFNQPVNLSVGLTPVYLPGRPPLVGAAIRGNAGMCWKNRWEAGALLCGSLSAQNHFGDWRSAEFVEMVGIGPYIRVYQPLAQAKLFAEASYGLSLLRYVYGIGGQWAGSSNNLGETILVGVGADIPLGQHLTLELACPFVQERNLSRPQQTLPLRTLLPSVGLQFHLATSPI